MNKAYDRIEWGFIEGMMKKLNFCDTWIAWIMDCISSVSFNIQLSGRKIAQIKPQRDLRQGDPLSPYLFILASEVFSSMLSIHAKHGNFRGINITRGGSMLTHCLFADDTIIFMQAEAQNCRLFMEILREYCKCSGQRVNYDKSSLFFSPNR
ncbi:uncharacterized protein LOC114758739 [Neltuma alba]|uniref:uncharacterized protein LOC114758739 n=1 Tax=Neltuma alba TaxID=207710 RepID=UPI0010A461A8|nr:uncharacterized protein LOC114758739 [Prosopis alba]